MEDSGSVTLLIDGDKFCVKKDMLCEHSDYFRAMFSGNYVENERNTVSIDVVDAHSMALIISYMELGLIVLSEHSLSVISDLAIAARFLQITELTKQIEYCLEIQLSLENWVEIMDLAQGAALNKLEQHAAVFGLNKFKYMRYNHIPTMQKLYWYLSHPYLDTESESDVFKFGIEWIKHKHGEMGADAILVLLCCLDISNLTEEKLLSITVVMDIYCQCKCLAAKVIECLQELISGFHCEITVRTIIYHKKTLCELFTEKVYNITLNLVKENNARKLQFTPVVALLPNTVEPVVQNSPHYLFTFSEETGYQKFIEVAERDLWGWSIVSWDATKIVVVCGEYGRGTGKFMNDVKVYDIFKKEWIQHGVKLPNRRHAGVAIVEDSLYIVGGVGGFRIVLDTALVYNLKERSYRKIKNFPDAIQNPAVCAYRNQIFAAGQKNIYQYDGEYWTLAIRTELRPNCMISYQGYIYVTQGYFLGLYRFRPGIDESLDVITSFSNPPEAICNTGLKLLAFTGISSLGRDVMHVEEYRGLKDPNCNPSIVWPPTGSNGCANSDGFVNSAAGSCSVLIDVPPIHPPIPPYHKKILSEYKHLYPTAQS